MEGGTGDLKGGGDSVIWGEYAGTERSKLKRLFDDDAAT